MCEIPLSPYFGKLVYCKSKRQFNKVFKSLSGEKHREIKHLDGIAQWLKNEDGESIFLVTAKDQPTLAHELSHVILFVFRECSIDPTEANGEPFCYMLSYLMEQCLES